MLRTFDISQDGLVGVVSCWECHGDGVRNDRCPQQLLELSYMHMYVCSVHREGIKLKMFIMIVVSVHTTMKCDLHIIVNTSSKNQELVAAHQI